MAKGLIITHMPRAFDQARGQEAREACPWASGPVADLIAGTGGSSPYLLGLMQTEGDWLGPALDDPDGALAAQAAALEAAAPDTLASDLRQAKRRLALLVALADLSGAWPLMRVTGALTDFAVLSVRLALRAAIAPLLSRGAIPGQGEDALEDAGGMIVLAMGKMGAGELNYSSDIDLICLYDDERFDPSDYATARAGFVKATRKMTATLNDRTHEGYVFRTDLRLRPDPAVTPVCMAVAAAERYYESLGRTWERAAYIKARVIAGDAGAGQRFLKHLEPFVWRRHLDFATIRDAHDMRLRIRAQKRDHGPITLPCHDMKLGRGGIREIEFFTQTRQIIAGGRDPGLRARGTLDGLAALADRKWVPPDDAARLADHYVQHRMVEHRLQMIADAQTHALPGDEAGFARLAALSGRDMDEMRADIARRLTEVHALTEDFFAPDRDAPAPVALPDALKDSPLPDRWPTYPALRSARAAEALERLKPHILQSLADAARPDEALAGFDAFLAGLPTGVQILSLFQAHPHLIGLLIDIVATAPDLGRYLARNPQVFDAVLSGDFYAPWPGRVALRTALASVLERETDYERRLDRARVWWREWHFRIGVHLLRGLKDAEEAGRAYADLAEATISAMFPVVVAEFARRHGPPPGGGAAVLGMGSLGAGRLHARSDLDLIVIYDAGAQDMSEGRRPLSAPAYYARLTKALILALSAQTAEGRLYEVDMRLRPSGNQGPVATSWRAFQSYQGNEAWVWEHLALTRARPMAGPGALCTAIEAFRLELLSRPRERAEILRAVAEMRARILAAKGEGGIWDPKSGPGRMMDIELLAQAAALLAPPPVRQTPRAIGRARFLEPDHRALLRAAYARQWAVQIGARLMTEGPLQVDELGRGGRAFLARLAGTEDLEALAQTLTRDAARVRAAIDAALAAYGPEQVDGARDEKG
jgi:glutamate-ammonia-ligase adenylyltransferase